MASKRSSGPSLARRAQVGWNLLVDDPTLHPADVLAAIVWPRREELQDDRCSQCDRRVKALGLCARHYWTHWNEERKAA